MRCSLQLLAWVTARKAPSEKKYYKYRWLRSWRISMTDPIQDLGHSGYSPGMPVCAATEPVQSKSSWRRPFKTSLLLRALEGCVP